MIKLGANILRAFLKVTFFIGMCCVFAGIFIKHDLETALMINGLIIAILSSSILFLETHEIKG